MSCIFQKLFKKSFAVSVHLQWGPSEDSPAGLEETVLECLSVGHVWYCSTVALYSTAVQHNRLGRNVKAMLFYFYQTFG